MSRDLALREANQLRAALLDHGVRKVSIELQQGRPGTPNDRWLDTRFLAPTSHHIVSRRSQGLTPGLALVKRGRSDVPGPLANLYGGFDRISRILCMGWANHPGAGGPLVVRGFRIPRDTGRPYLMGTEFEGGIDEDDWTDEFREFMGRHNAGVTDYLGASPKDHIEHKTWAPTRKIDRLGYTTASGRAEVARWYGTPTPEPEDQPMSTQEKNEILQAIEGLADQARDINVTTVEQAKRIREGMVALIAGLDNVDEVALAAEVSRLMVPAVVAAVAEKATLSEDDVEQAIRDVLGSLANA